MDKNVLKAKLDFMKCQPESEGSVIVCVAFFLPAQMPHSFLHC